MSSYHRNGILGKVAVALAALYSLYAASSWACGQLTFAMPAGRGKFTQGTPHVSVQKNTKRRPRDDMPRQSLEAVEERAVEEEAAAPEPLMKRVPYTMNFFVHGGSSTDGKGSANWKYLERKLVNALENVQDWVQGVDVRLTIEEHAHKLAAQQRHANAEDESSSPERRQLAPYRLEVTVKMDDEGSSVVLSKPKHAQATFVEAVDHMHDTLKRMMRKEKEKRVSRKRRSARRAEFGQVDERMTEEEIWAAANGL